MQTATMMSVASALISGVTPKRTFERISTGKVLEPGPEVKLAMTTSSSDKVKASSQPASSAGQILSLIHISQGIVR